jgi:hypothetical protein
MKMEKAHYTNCSVMSEYYSCCIQNEDTKPAHKKENDHKFVMWSHSIKVELSTSTGKPMYGGDICGTPHQSVCMSKSTQRIFNTNECIDQGSVTCLLHGERSQTTCACTQSGFVPKTAVA